MINASIIIPTRNRPQLLYEALNFLIPQLDSKDQIVVVNDGDNRLSDIPSTNIRIDILDSKRDFEGRGVAKACNIGFQAAIHDLIMIYEDDYLPDSDWADIFKKHYQENLLLLGIIHREQRDGSIERDWRLDQSNIPISKLIQYGGGNFACNRKRILDVGGYPEEFTGGYGFAETALFYKLIKNGIEIKLCSATITHRYVEHSRDFSHFSNVERNRRLFYQKYYFSI